MFGAWSLHYWTQQLKMELDFFVLYSSIAAFVGNVGQANSCSCQRILGCASTRATGTGPCWAEHPVGAMGRDGHGGGLPGAARRAGADGFVDAGGRESGGGVLSAPQLQGVAVVRADWRRLAQGSTGEMKRFTRYLTASLRQEIAVGASATPRLSQHEQERSRATRIAEVKKQLKGIVAELVHVDSANLDDDAGFTSLGFDSLLAVELRNRVQAAFGNSVAVPATVMFDYPSIGKLSEYIVRQTAGEAALLAALPSGGEEADVHHHIAVVGMAGCLPASTQACRRTGQC